jgi:hypothetical protein
MKFRQPLWACAVASAVQTGIARPGSSHLANYGSTDQPTFVLSGLAPGRHALSCQRPAKGVNPIAPWRVVSADGSTSYDQVQLHLYRSDTP